MTCDTDTNTSPTAGRIERQTDPLGCSEYLLNEAGTIRIAALGDWLAPDQWGGGGYGYVNDGPAEDDHVGPIARSFADFADRCDDLAARLIAEGA